MSASSISRIYTNTLPMNACCVNSDFVEKYVVRIVIGRISVRTTVYFTDHFNQWSRGFPSLQLDTSEDSEHTSFPSLASKHNVPLR